MFELTKGSNVSRYAVISTGNPTMGDDGMGKAVLDMLEGEGAPEGFDLVDAGTGGMILLHILKDYDGVIILDAVDFGGQPGEVVIFTPEKAVSVKSLKRYSLHEGDLMQVINLSKKVGESPETIYIIGVQPRSLDMVNELSTEVQGSLGRVKSEVLQLAKEMYQKMR